MFGWLMRLLGGRRRFESRFDLAELERRLGLPHLEIERTPVAYRTLDLAKRSGGTRRLAIPNPTLKTLQRRVLRRVLGKLAVHTAACGFERGKSIVDHARRHVGKQLVVRFDVKDFFTSTSEARVREYFAALGWTEPAAALLTRLCTFEGSLPQGAPTSPRLSNLLNYRLDVRLAKAAARLGAVYSRYADDLTFSFVEEDGSALGGLMRCVPRILAEFGYRLNRRKTRCMRRHQRQQVTGLVVNERAGLPRDVRRRLRAIEHQRRTRGESTLNDAQYEGWLAYRSMIEHGRDL